MRITLFILLLASFYGRSQDTIRVYFEFGSAKVDLMGRTELLHLSTNYDLNQLDSVQFIGSADSVGNMNSNLKLSKKRAKSAYKLCKKAFEKDLEYSILARGEGTKSDPKLNRRVDVILHYFKEVKAPVEVIENVDPKCFFTAFEALEFCNVRTITKKRKRVAHIEAMNISYFEDTKLYYVKSGREGSKDVRDVRRVKWKKKKTGILWWKKARYVAEIPQSSYDQFQFFTLEDGPCKGCKESIFTKDTIIRTVLQAHPDMFLMYNMQTRLKVFGKQKLKIRVPREYVDLTEKYYASSSGYEDHHNKLIEWQTKKGKKRQKFYFARVELPENRYPVIKKYSLTTECMNKPDGIGGLRGLDGFWINCISPGGGGLAGTVKFDAGLGSFYQNDTVTAYLALGVSYNGGGHVASFKLGINTHLGLYTSVNYDYHFIGFPMNAINPFNGWKMSGVGKSFRTFGTFYGGLEFKSIHKKTYFSFAETNAHLGFSVSNYAMKDARPEFYIKSGVGRDLLNRVNDSFYPFVEVGFVMHLF